MFGIVQKDIAAAQGSGEKHRTDGEDSRATEQAVSALLAGFPPLSFVRLGR
jgi:hypothetical protein